MKKLITCLAAALAVTALPVATMAQTAGSKPGVYDVSRVTGWEYRNTGQADVWLHTNSFTSAGTSCNIITNNVGLSNDAIQREFGTYNEEQYRAQADAMSAEDYLAIGPFQTVDIDGVDATRYTLLIADGAVRLTATQYQVGIDGHLLTVTCGAAESSFGGLVDDMEWFVDAVQFGQGFTSAKIENAPSTDGVEVVTVSEQAVSPDLLAKIAAEALNGFLAGARADKSE